MHLVSQVDQQVQVAGETFHFEAGETIHTESSYKYALDDVRRVARQAGLAVVAVWTDPDTRFGVHYLERAPST